MEYTGILRWLLFQDVHSTLSYPSPYFACQKQHKYCKHPTTNIVAERRHSQKSVENSIPGLFRKLFNLDLAKRTIE